jgi:hypothetical protein
MSVEIWYNPNDPKPIKGERGQGKGVKSAVDFLKRQLV